MLSERLPAVTLFIVLTSWFHCAGEPLLRNWGFKESASQFAGRPIIYLPKTESPPKIDGILDDAAWKKAWQTSLTLNLGVAPSNPTTFMAAYDNQALYLAARCSQGDINNLVRNVPAGSRDGVVWHDDCIDFKIGIGSDVCQFIVNTNGAWADIRNEDATWNPNWRFHSVLDKGGYTVEMAIPLMELGLARFEPGFPILMTFGRIDKGGRQSAAPMELSSIAPPFGNMENAPVFVLGNAEEHKKFSKVAPPQRISAIKLYLDREVYPSFESFATGRVKLVEDVKAEPVKNELSLVLAILREEKDVSSERIAPVKGHRMDFDLWLKGLKPGSYEVEVRLLDGENVIRRQRRPLVIRAENPPRSGSITLTVPPAPAEREAWPITFGVPFPWGALYSEDNVIMRDASGKEIPIQTAVTGRWSREGSIRWLLVDAIVPVSRRSRSYTLTFGPDIKRAPAAATAKVEENERDVYVDTGAIRFAIPKSNTPGLSQVWLRDKALFSKAGRIGPYMVDEGGTEYYGSADPLPEVVVESQGPLKACVQVSGWHVAQDGRKLGKYILRYYAYAGLPYIRLYHTFIITEDTDKVRYNDIGYALPISERACLFGTSNIVRAAVGGKGVPPESAGAYLLQRDDLYWKVYSNGKFQEDGGRAEGWVNVGPMALGVRDFWQNFPKELEVTPERTIVHFWPAHGEPPIHTGEYLTHYNNYRLWFAHEGKVLNFKVPKEAYSLMEAALEDADHAAKANAIGVAKTHEMLLHFYEGDWDTAGIPSTQRIFQSGPTGICDPAWVCASRALGYIAPIDKKKYPAIAEIVENTADALLRDQEANRDYGMWNFGDSHQTWIYERRWQNWRVWRMTHHNWPRWPWLLYAASGEKRILDWAERNAKRTADICHCHYTTEEFTKKPYPTQKIVGGLCDYKGLVPWNSGARFCYNSVADAILHHYYFTGDERSRTTAAEIGAGLIQNPKPYIDRDGSARVTSAVELYLWTWNNDFLELIEEHVDLAARLQQPDGGYAAPGAAGRFFWTPHMERYIEFSGSSKAATILQRLVDWKGWDNRDKPHTDLMKLSATSYLYLHTGEVKYLKYATLSIRYLLSAVYWGEDPKWQGTSVRHASSNGWAWFLLHVPTYLAALEKHGSEPVVSFPPEAGVRLYARETENAFYGLWRQKEDRPLSIRLKLLGSGYSLEVQPITGGKTLTAAAKLSEQKDYETLELEIPKDDVLEYAFRIRTPKTVAFSLPLLPPESGVQEIYLLSPSAGIFTSNRFYFNVPPGAASLELNYHTFTGRHEIRVYDGTGNRCWQDFWCAANATSLRRKARIKIKSPLEGWSLEHLGPGWEDSAGYLYFELQAYDANNAILKGHKFWIALTPENLFKPTNEKWEWR